MTRSRSGPRIAISVSMARLNTGHGIGVSCVENETGDAVAVLGLGDEAHCAHSSAAASVKLLRIDAPLIAVDDFRMRH